VRYDLLHYRNRIVIVEHERHQGEQKAFRDGAPGTVSYQLIFKPFTTILTGLSKAFKIHFKK
jgi:hypothetical protein